jgi:hypothetical protein
MLQRKTFIQIIQKFRHTFVAALIIKDATDFESNYIVNNFGPMKLSSFNKSSISDERRVINKNDLYADYVILPQNICKIFPDRLVSLK